MYDLYSLIYIYMYYVLYITMYDNIEPFYENYSLIDGSS